MICSIREYLHLDGELYPVNQVTCVPIGLGAGAWARFADLDEFPRVKQVWVPGLAADVQLEPQHGMAAAYAAAGGNGIGFDLDLFGDLGGNQNFLLWAGVAAVGAFLLVRR
jgi:hypothetical protein